MMNALILTNNWVQTKENYFRDVYGKKEIITEKPNG